MTVPGAHSDLQQASLPRDRGPRVPVPRLSLAIRMAVHALAGFLWLYPLTTPFAVLVSAACAAFGAGLGAAIAATRLRSFACIPIVLLLIPLGSLLNYLVSSTEIVPFLLGPTSAVVIGEIAFFSLAALSTSAVLVLLSLRVSVFLAVEATLVASSLVNLVVSHRMGAIHRPFSVADPILARGGDPTLALLLFGAGTTVVIVLLLLDERRPWRILLHLGVVALLLGVVALFVRQSGLPTPPPPEAGLGLQGTSEENAESISGRGGKGTNENLEFQDNYDSSGNQAPVAVVLFHDDYSSPTGVYYFRQGAFSQYNGRRLVQSTLPSADRDIALRFPTVRAVDPSDAPDEDAARQPVETTVALLSDHIRPFGLEAPVSFGPASNPDPARFKRTYTVSSLSMSRGYFDLLFSPLGNPEWSDAERAHYLDAPEDRRYRELAESIIEEALPAHLRALPLARAFAVAKWLGEKGVYSLRSDHAQAADPTAHFLFGDLKGYCVHFAHAGTYLLRTLGIAARVATGYAVSESARHGGSALLLSGANSHAWPEVYVDGFGWLVLDIQPQSTLDPPPSAPDPELQRLLGELARGLHPLPVEGMRSFSELKDSAAGFAKTAAMLLGISLGIAALIMVFIKSYRRLIPRIAKDRDQPRLAYRRELDRLSEHGLSRLRGETREGFALRVAAIAPSFRNLTRVHLEATFGRAGDHLGNGARQSADAVRAEIRAAFPRFRRWFGLIRFWSFLRSR